MLIFFLPCKSRELVATGKGFAPELELVLDFNRLSMENIPVELGADDSMIRTTLQYKILKTQRARIAAGGKILVSHAYAFSPLVTTRKPTTLKPH